VAVYVDNERIEWRGKAEMAAGTTLPPSDTPPPLSSEILSLF
jgi:hypothetical protein